MLTILLVLELAVHCLGDHDATFNLTDGTRIEGRIVGGVAVDIRDFAYQVAVLRNGLQICGGALISNRTVLTAAHCLEPDVITSVGQLSVRLGSSLHQSGGERISAASYKIHEKYDYRDASAVDYDIGIIHLASVVTTGYATPLAMDFSGRSYSAGEMVTVSGWGDTYEGSELGSTELRAVQVPVVSQSNCRRIYGNVISSRMWCAGLDAGGKDACQGDSGGPAVINGKLAGIVSFGGGCARAGVPGVYSSVPAYRAWITANNSGLRIRHSCVILYCILLAMNVV
ncbi:trypsin beta-like [Cylas formicarius]|uniref:trypsin beta-like n=1 Tax=Cylas formicarius TaxID=197179 RepID=UPI002958AD78|nr:trypsin beta-like [Cylas formicarius]